MNALLISLLVVGLIFPAVSLLTLVASWVDWWRHKKHSSAVLIPFVGPTLLTAWVLLGHKPIWVVPIVWVTDLGTVLFLAVCPEFVGEWWRHSSFTRILILRGSSDNQIVVLTLHSTGNYFLKKTWTNPRQVPGMIGLGEGGTFVQKDGRYILHSQHGIERALCKADENTYVVKETTAPDENLRKYSLQGWLLKA